MQILRRCSREEQNGGGLSVKQFDFGLSEEGLFRPSACSPPNPESGHCCWPHSLTLTTVVHCVPAHEKGVVSPTASMNEFKCFVRRSHSGVGEMVS